MKTLNPITVIVITLALSFLAVPIPVLLAEEPLQAAPVPPVPEVAPQEPEPQPLPPAVLGNQPADSLAAPAPIEPVDTDAENDFQRRVEELKATYGDDAVTTAYVYPSVLNRGMEDELAALYNPDPDKYDNYEIWYGAGGGLHIIYYGSESDSAKQSSASAPESATEPSTEEPAPEASPEEPPDEPVNTPPTLDEWKAGFPEGTIFLSADSLQGVGPALAVITDADGNLYVLADSITFDYGSHFVVHTAYVRVLKIDSVEEADTAN